MSSRYSACFSFTGPTISSRSTCEKPMIAFSGVRSSWDMLARNSDLCRLASSSSAYTLRSSSFIRLTLVASSQLVAVLDVDMPLEVPRRDRRESAVDALDRTDQRPRQDEPQQQGEHERAGRDADEQARARERAGVPGDQLVDLGLVPSARAARRV